MLEQSIVDYWGWDNLVRWSEQELSKQNLSRSATHFLGRVGLPAPKRDIGPWRLTWASHLIGSVSDPALVVLGRNYMQPCVLDRMTDSIFWEENEELPRQFVNSSVECFAACLSAFDRFLKKGLTYDDRDIEFQIEAFEAELMKLDPVGFANRDGVWSMEIFSYRMEI